MPFEHTAPASAVMKAARAIFKGRAVQVGILDMMPYQAPGRS